MLTFGMLVDFEALKKEKSRFVFRINNQKLLNKLFI